MSLLKIVRASALAVLIAGSFTAANAEDVAVPDYVAAALADTSRPAEDTARDAARKPGQVLAMTGVKAGDKVADVAPGTGYYTRLFAKIVGPEGMVYTYNADWVVARRGDAIKAFDDSSASQANVKPVVTPMVAPVFPEKLDVFFMSQFYHDGHFQKIDMAAMNKAIWDALKPGGTFFIVDHSAEAGSGTRDAGTLHRIDPETVKQEVLAAGFVLEAESDILKNPDDARKVDVFDPSIRGKTDQFILKFKKPAS
jgi:predicted methyltransferase